MRLKIDIQITDDQVIKLLQLYKYGLNVGMTKAGFIVYVRLQLEQFGNGDGLLGQMDEYPSLTQEDYSKLLKWGMIETIPLDGNYDWSKK